MRVQVSFEIEIPGDIQQEVNVAPVSYHFCIACIATDTGVSR